MKVRVNIDRDNIKINNTFSGANADEIVGALKSRVAQDLPFAMRLLVNSMGNLAFAQEMVRRYNSAQQQNIPLPQTCDEFLKLAETAGICTTESE